MQLGFVSAILPDRSLEEVMNTAARLGYDCVEVMCWPLSQADRRYGGVTHLDATLAEAELIDRAAAVTGSSGIAISGLGYYPNCLAADCEEAAQAVEHLQRLIRLAPKLGLNRVNTFIGKDHTQGVDENWLRLLETWRPIVELAEDLGVFIGIENCPMYFTRDEWPGGKNIAISPAIWRRLFNDLPSPHLGLNFDPSHFVWQQMDYLKPLREFADRLFHLHLKDAQLLRDRLSDLGIFAYPKEYHVPRIPGRGEIDWAAFFQCLHQIGYSGAACVEVEDPDFENSLVEREQSLELSQRFLEPLVRLA